MKTKKYTNPTNFRRALENRLGEYAKKEGIGIQKLRRQVAFDRLLARLFQKKSAALPWALKGGYAMELRVKSARATKDIDLAVRDAKLLSSNSNVQNQAIRKLLQEHSGADLGDFFIYEIGDPMMDLDAAPDGGGRFSVEALMDERTFVKFHVDVGVGDVWMEPLESIQIHDWLSFAAIEPTSVLAISKEQQFAEKIHAYTLPRGDRQNSRVKDLVDMVLLIQGPPLSEIRLSEAIHATFRRRRTHEYPTKLLSPPAEWRQSFVKLAAECGLNENIEKAFLDVQSYIEKIKKTDQL